MMLTPEQMREFEARADAGEKPTEGMWQQPEKDKEIFCVVPYPLSPIYAIATVMRFDHPSTFYGVFAFGRAFYRWKFASPVSAQLAAEHLIREATAPLYAKELRELKRAKDEATELYNILELFIDAAYPDGEPYPTVLLDHVAHERLEQIKANEAELEAYRRARADFQRMEKDSYRLSCEAVNNDARDHFERMRRCAKAALNNIDDHLREATKKVEGEAGQ